MEPHFSQTFLLTRTEDQRPPRMKFASFYRIETLSWETPAPEIHLAQSSCVMESKPWRILKGRTGCTESFSVHADTREPVIARRALAACFDSFGKGLTNANWPKLV